MGRAILRLFTRSEQGQDLSEYCLITALISLIALGIIWHVSGGLDSGWSSANTTLNAGNTTGATQTVSQ